MGRWQAAFLWLAMRYFRTAEERLLKLCAMYTMYNLLILYAQDQNTRVLPLCGADLIHSAMAEMWLESENCCFLFVYFLTLAALNPTFRTYLLCWRVPSSGPPVQWGKKTFKKRVPTRMSRIMLSFCVSVDESAQISIYPSLGKNEYLSQGYLDTLELSEEL